jgi:hypothetical protein
MTNNDIIEPRDGMLLSDAEVRRLPGWLDDDNAELELIAATRAVALPEDPPIQDEIWQLHKTGPWPTDAERG